MSSTYLSPFLNFYKHARSNNNSCVSADLSSVGVREVGISFPLFSALLAGLLCWLACFSNTMLHTFVCFTSCNCSDPSVLVAGKSHSRTEILVNTGTHLKNSSKSLECAMFTSPVPATCLFFVLQGMLPIPMCPVLLDWMCWVGLMGRSGGHLSRTTPMFSQGMHRVVTLKW